MSLHVGTIDVQRVDNHELDGYGMNDDTLRDHLENPCNRGLLRTATLTGTKRNPVCADEVTLSLKVEASIIEEAWHQVRGCLLCRASASVLCEKLQRMSLSDAKLLSDNDALTWIGFTVSPGRIRCCVLPVQTLQQLLISYDEEISVR